MYTHACLASVPILRGAALLRPKSEELRNHTIRNPPHKSNFLTSFHRCARMMRWRKGPSPFGSYALSIFCSSWRARPYRAPTQPRLRMTIKSGMGFRHCLESGRRVFSLPEARLLLLRSARERHSKGTALSGILGSAHFLVAPEALPRIAASCSQGQQRAHTLPTQPSEIRKLALLLNRFFQRQRCLLILPKALVRRRLLQKRLRQIEMVGAWCEVPIKKVKRCLRMTLRQTNKMLGYAVAVPCP